VTDSIDTTTDERYVLRRNPIRKKEIRISRSERQFALETHVKKSMIYLKEHPRAKVDVQTKRLEGRLKKLKLKNWLSIKKDGREITLVIDNEALKKEEEFDGCYALRTNLSREDCSAEKVHERYKSLAEVEFDFRTMKTGHMEIRPFFVIKEENTRAHALTAMLALKIRRYLAEAWKGENLTVEEGLRQLETLPILQLEDKDGLKHELLPKPNDLQARLLALAGVALPTSVPPPQAVPVVTRKQLPEERKVA
jgi:transposase